MGVGQDAELHLGEIHPQGVRVPGESLAGSGVQQVLAALVLDVDGQPPLGGEVGVVGNVINEDRGDHGMASQG